MGKLGATLSGKNGDLIIQYYPHHIFLDPNLHSNHRSLAEGEAIGDQCYYKTSSFDFSLPLPVLPMRKVPKTFLRGIDPVKRIVDEKYEWQECFKRELCLAHKSLGAPTLKKSKKTVTGKNRVCEIRREILLLSKILDNDPDDQFSGYYNWYYSGGNINHISLCGHKYLLQPFGKKFNILEAVPISVGQNVYMKADYSNRIRCSLESKEPLLQIVTSEEKRFVGVRQRKKCTIFSLSDNDDPNFIKLDEVMSLIPYTSIDFDKGSKERYVVMKTDSSCCLNDIRRRKLIREWEVPECSDRLVDKWCSAFFGQNRDTIMCLNRRFIRTYDARAKNMNCITLCPANETELLENCEEISCAVEGCHDVDHPLIYISTYHHLFGMDLRFPRAFVQRWSHGMKHAPCYMTTSLLNKDYSTKRTEVVLLGSQIAKEIHSVINDFSADDKFEKGFSSLFPISLPTQVETMNLAHWHGRLLDPFIQKRLSTVTTGICCFNEQKEGITCFQRNSVGDIFQQHLLFKYSQHQIELPEVLEHISNWQKSKPKKSRKKLETVTFTDFGLLLERINHPLFSLPKIKEKSIENQKWCISKRKMLSYRDMLAPKMLEVWELDNEDEWNENENEWIEPVLPPSQEPVDKVQEWLGQNIFLSTPIASQETQQENDSQLNLSLSPIIDRGVSERKKLNRQSKTLQKKRFVDGF